MERGMIARQTTPHQVSPPALVDRERWRLVLESLPDAAAQMAVDQVLAEAVWQGQAMPTLRLYRWPAPGVTVGRHQPPGTLRCPAVRRMTGGHAVFHDHELTFSLAVPSGHRLLSGGARAAYRTVAAACEQALVAIGLPVASGNPHAPARPQRVFSCFTGATREETAVDGYKLVAIAQRHTRHGLLVQGSIPLSAPAGLPGATDSGVLGLDRLLPEVDWETLAEAIQNAFSERLGADFDSVPLAPEELRAAVHLAHNGYTPLSGPIHNGPDTPQVPQKTPQEAPHLTEKWTEGPQRGQPAPMKEGGHDGRVPCGSST
jgi:lipoate-protein ligase A